MNRPIILIVDGDFDSRTIFRAALEWRGYSVLSTGEGPEAVELFKQHRPEVVIGDFPIARERGKPPLTEATLRGELSDSHPQILTVTARPFAFETSEASGPREQADAVFLKPVEPLKILEEIERRLGAGPH